MFPQQMFRSRANRETFRETCFLSDVSTTMFPRLQGPLKQMKVKIGGNCIFIDRDKVEVHKKAKSIPSHLNICCVLEAAGQGPYLRPRAQFFPIRAFRPVNNIN